MVQIQPTYEHAPVLEIPPTGVGGLFRSNLHTSTHRFLKSHPREWVDGSDPASDTKRPNEWALLLKRTGWLDVNNWIHKRLLAAGRLDLNNPHTAVWGIHKRLVPAGRLDLNNPHTAVWGIHWIDLFTQELLLKK